MTTSLPQGKFLWHELVTSDVEGAKSFYSRVVGWNVEPFEASPTPYWLWTAFGHPAAGLMGLPEESLQQGIPPYWLGYVHCSNLNSSCEQVRNLGGEIVIPPVEMDGVGRFAQLNDSQGAPLGLMEPADPPPAPSEQESPDGKFAWAELAVNDPEAAMAFYTGLFGWQETDVMDMGEDGIYRMFGGADGATLGGMYKKPDQMPASAWLYYATVPDLDESVGTTQSLGGTVLRGPVTVPGDERVAMCIDPQGAAFALHAFK